MALNITDLIQHPEKLSDRLVIEELSALLCEYPYYQTARLLYLKGLYLLRDSTFGEELQKSAFYVSNRKVLFYLIEGEHYAMNPIGHRKGAQKGDSIAGDRTLTLIDAFLNGLPVEAEENEKDKIAIVDDGGLSSDYTSYILRADDLDETEKQKTLPRMKGEDLIDDFIRKTDTRISVDWDDNTNPEGPDLTAYDEEDDSCFTETLAKIYMKQHRYAKALEIIQRLSLKYPKKSAYFADQIRTLEKLVINSNDK